MSAEPEKGEDGKHDDHQPHEIDYTVHVRSLMLRRRRSGDHREDHDFLKQELRTATSVPPKAQMTAAPCSDTR
jgi:hypothetical protein